MRWIFEIKGVLLKYIKLIKDMSCGAITSVWKNGGITNEFPMIIGLY